MLNCAHCDHAFALTVGRYFKGRSGDQICPQCQAECKLALPGWLKTLENAVLIPGIAAASLIGILVLDSLLLALVLSFLWMAVNIPLNIWLDGKYGWLVLQRPGKALPPELPPAAD